MSVNVRDFMTGKLAGLREAEAIIKDAAAAARVTARRWGAEPEAVCRAVGEHYERFGKTLDRLAEDVGRRAVDTRRAVGRE